MLKIIKIDKNELKERILAVYCGNHIYVGLGNKLINYSKQKVMCIHEKSIRCVSGSEKFIGCSSYDGTATIFNIEDKYIDKIEGPDTEIKGISFNNNVIALTTRGKTTWILENLEISKILDDHTQDVKGCKFDKNKLYTWSYDNTIKVYELFEIDHSWELSQSIDLEDIVWNVLFYKEFMCACLNNGTVVFMKFKSGLWETFKIVPLSVTPVYTGVTFFNYVGFVCNQNSMLILNENLENVCEIADLNSGCDIFSCSFYEKENLIVLGSDNGCLTTVAVEEHDKIIE